MIQQYFGICVRPLGVRQYTGLVESLGVPVEADRVAHRDRVQLGEYRPELLHCAQATAPAAVGDGSTVADARVATLAPHLADPPMSRLVDELTAVAGTTFTSRAHGPPRTPARTGIEELRHPDAGELRLAFEMLTLQRIGRAAGDDEI